MATGGIEPQRDSFKVRVLELRNSTFEKSCLVSHHLSIRLNACTAYIFLTNCNHCRFGLVNPSDWDGLWIIESVFPHMSQLLICQVLRSHFTCLLFIFHICVYTCTEQTWLYNSMTSLVEGWSITIIINFHWEIGKQFSAVLLGSVVYLVYLGSVLAMVFPRVYKWIFWCVPGCLVHRRSLHVQLNFSSHSLELWSLNWKPFYCLPQVIRWTHISFKQQYIHFRKKKVILKEVQNVHLSHFDYCLRNSVP